MNAPKRDKRKAREWFVHWCILYGMESCDAEEPGDVCLACQERDTGPRILVREVLPKPKARKP